ncbi:MAG: TldD/PmbA family protein [Ignisphaera sp.]|uniref:TldD/PmbA family protein n=1 Tax=Ignisphaera aggregans TaxID=334771 RepID=A0A7C4NMQ6_9CREN
MSEDLALYAVDYACKLGALYSEARIHRVDEFTVMSRNGVIVGSSKEASNGIGVRVLVDGALGFASTNTLSKEAIRRIVEEAYSHARALSKVMKKPITFAPGRLGRVSYSVEEEKKFSDLVLDEKIKLHSDLWKRVSSAVSEARVNVLTLRYIESVEEKIVVNSEGALVKSRIPRLCMMLNIVISHPQKGTIQRLEEHGGSGGLEWLKKWDLEEKLAEDVKRYERILLEAIEPPKEEIPVVVGSEIVGIIVHESCGHPSEADRILGREAAQAGKSFIKPNMVGYRIGNELATVVDNPTIPGSFGFYLYDDEGVAARPKYLYREGIVNEFLHNRWTASIFGVESNGSARSMNYASEPIPRMSNTYLKPGDHSFGELLEGIKLGVYVKSYMEWNIDDERWSQRYGGLEAYLIENGELTKYIRNPVLELTTKAFYSSIDAVGKELKFYTGFCGKGEPSQAVPVWFGGPDVRLKKIRLGVG